MANTTGMKFGGRKKGTPNKSTSEIRTLAQEYGPEAIRRLVSLMRQSDDRKLQFAAARELLYRGHGRPTEVVESSDEVVESSDAESTLREVVERVRARLRVNAGRALDARPVIRPSGDLQIASKP
jgi:hypothetical protein